jgi:hypothetical protein
MAKLLEFVHISKNPDTLWDVMCEGTKIGIIFLDNFQLYFEAADDSVPCFTDYTLREILDFMEPRQKQIDKDLNLYVSSSDVQPIDPYENK